ncbi:MAG: ABC transporter substrate-binding protein [Chitinispirillaceae bacterium]
MRKPLFYCLMMILCGIMLLIISDVGHAQRSEPAPQRIVMFTPTTEDNTYWPQVYRIVETVSDDLGVDILPYEFDVGDRFATHQEGIQILDTMVRPDGAIFSVVFGQTRPLLQVTEKMDLPVMILGPLFPDELPRIGTKPRKEFESWIGYFYQDESQKGYLLGKALLKAAHDANLYAEDGSIQVIGISGDYSWFGSRRREEGLRRAVKEDTSARLLQIVNTLWTPEEAREKTTRLMMRYPRTGVVWAASDQLALGAADALREGGHIPGQTVLVGGLDLSLAGLQAVKNNVLHATVSSFMLFYARMLVYLYDYINGFDFADEAGTTVTTDIHVVTKETADRFLRLYTFFNEIDFRKFSKVYNQSLHNYDFSLEKLEDALTH